MFHYLFAEVAKLDTTSSVDANFAVRVHAPLIFLEHSSLCYSFSCLATWMLMLLGTLIIILTTDLIFI